ncbi:MAG: TrbG/VirB9 family P-type conjugative transfer protein, partial [Burkholderiales bacterium]
MKPIAMAALLACIFPAHAELNPVHTPVLVDPRVRVVDYDPLQVLYLRGVPGFHIELQFAPGEQLHDDPGYSGDDKAFDVDGIANLAFIKPRATLDPLTKQWLPPRDAHTNITLVTKRAENRLRVYRIRYEIATKAKAPQVTAVLYRYAADETEARVAREREGEVNALIKNATNAKPQNRDYSFCGAEQLRPMLDSVFDVGDQTFMQWPANAELPQVYFQRQDGSQGIPNHHFRADDVMVL